MNQYLLPKFIHLQNLVAGQSLLNCAHVVCLWSAFGGLELELNTFLRVNVRERLFQCEQLPYSIVSAFAHI